MIPSLSCSEPLVWTCKACGHSFHTDEWQAHGRQCPACTEKRGEWKCSLCLGSFSQPALKAPHPCKKDRKPTANMVNGFPSTFVQDKWKMKGPLFFKKTKAINIAFVGFLFVGLSGTLAFFFMIDKKDSFELAKANNQKSHWGLISTSDVCPASLQDEEKLYEKAFALLKETRSFRAFLKGYEISLAKDKLTWHSLFNLEGPDVVVIEICTDFGDRSFPHKWYKVNTTTRICYEYDAASNESKTIK